ncbi:hypothetical protein ABZ746_28555 [Streptomyces sp. NPDC020096]
MTTTHQLPDTKGPPVHFEVTPFAPDGALAAPYTADISAVREVLRQAETTGQRVWIKPLPKTSTLASPTTTADAELVKSPELAHTGTPDEGA